MIGLVGACAKAAEIRMGSWTALNRLQPPSITGHGQL